MKTKEAVKQVAFKDIKKMLSRDEMKQIKGGSGWFMCPGSSGCFPYGPGDPAGCTRCW